MPGISLTYGVGPSARRACLARNVAWEVAVSFLIPTAILLVVFSQVKGFFGDRFNLTYQILTMFRTLPDICLLMLVGSLPDYLQGALKLYWVLAGRIREPGNRLLPAVR